MTITSMTPVESSNIAALGHDPVSQTLKVLFKNREAYLYQNVNAELFDRLLKADSVGKLFAAEIKKFPTQYPFSKEAANDPAL